MKISVVVPAYNEESVIDKCLERLRNQTFKDFELIVVDNNSEDLTSQVARKFTDKVLTEKRRGCAQARQTGFLSSSGDIIATTDADTLVNPDWLQIIHNQFMVSPAAKAVYGPIYFHDGNILEKQSSILYSYFMLFHHFIGLPSFWGCNFAVTRKAFDAVGGFNTNLSTSSDFDFSLRLRHIGKIQFNKALLVNTSARNSQFLYLTLNYVKMLVLRKSRKRIDIR